MCPSEINFCGGISLIYLFIILVAFLSHESCSHKCYDTANRMQFSINANSLAHIHVHNFAWFWSKPKVALNFALERIGNESLQNEHRLHSLKWPPLLFRPVLIGLQPECGSKAHCAKAIAEIEYNAQIAKSKNTWVKWAF